MFRKNYTDYEMTERIKIFWMELYKQCNEQNCNEFDHYWEMWGVMWMPWFIDVNKKSLTFTANDISSEDLKILVEQGKIEIVKIYEQSEMDDEFDKKRYRIIKNHSQQGIAKSGAEVLNRTFVLFMYFCAKLNICAF